MDSKYLIGKQIDNYLIIKHIARGGMADVYQAEDVDLKRNVALKVMIQSLAVDDQFVERFRREAQTVAKLDHPNIVQVYSVGVLPEGAPYIAMQFIDGGTLRDKLRQLTQRGKLLTTEQSLNIVRQVATALGVAHSAKVVHRDMKPGNVLIRPDGTPVLVDLGIASVAGSKKLTQTGSLIGTPNYMAPEQVRGQKLDGRSDLYSLGIILYEMLAGIRPFEADESIAVLHQQVYEEPTPVYSSRPDLAQETVDIVQTCMHKDPAQRFNDTQAMIAAIDKALLAEGASGPNPQATQVLTDLSDSALISRRNVVKPVVNSPPKSQPVVAEPTRRKVPLWAIITSLIALAAIVGLILFNPFDTITPTPTVSSITLRDDNEAEDAASTADPTETAAEPTERATETAVSPTLVQITPTNTAVPSPTPTNTPIPTDTPIPLESVTWELGRSRNDRPLQITRLGNGPKQLVFVGGIHGNEPTTQELVGQMRTYFQENPTLISADVTLYFLPILNPDAVAENSRYTPGGVDINRNWDTPSWVRDSPQPDGIRPNSGGTTPFSEPETAVFSDFLLEILNNSSTRDVSVILYHHHTGVPDVGSVQPGYIQYRSPLPPSTDLALTLVDLAGYDHLPFWDGPYTPTGEIIQWCTIQGIAAVDVELSRSESLNTVPAGRTETVLQTAVQSVIGLMQE